MLVLCPVEESVFPLSGLFKSVLVAGIQKCPYDNIKVRAVLEVFVVAVLEVFSVDKS